MKRKSNKVKNLSLTTIYSQLLAGVLRSMRNIRLCKISVFHECSWQTKNNSTIFEYSSTQNKAQ